MSARSSVKGKLNGSRTSIIDLDPQKEILFKMSKKIAQLTKVVYFLNTKNEDTNLQMKQMKRQYEYDLHETLEEGKSVISEMQLKLNESEDRVQYQETVIQTNLKTIIEKENEIAMIKEHSNRLEIQAKKQQTAISKLSTNVISDISHEKEITEIKLQYEDELERKDKHWEKEMEIQRDANEQRITEVRNQAQVTEDNLRNDVRILQNKIEDEINKRNVEIAAMKDFMNAREIQIREEMDTILSRMRINLEAETKKVKDLEETVYGLREQIDRKTLIIEGLEMDKWELGQKIQQLERSLEDKTNDFNLLTTEHKFLTELCKSYGNMLSIYRLEIKIPKLERDLNDTRSSLHEAKTLLATETERNENLSRANDTLQMNLDETLNKLLKTQEEVKNLTERSELYFQDICSKDNLINELNSAMIKQNRELRQEMKTALEELSAQLNGQKEQEIEVRISAFLEEKKLMLDKKDAEILQLNQEKSNMLEEHKKAILEMEQKFADNQVELNSKITKLNEDWVTATIKIQESKSEIEERDKRIAADQLTLQNRDTTIKGLEVDLADLFQKMVQCDKQIRSEMAEKYTKEKYDLEAEWNTRNQANLEMMKKRLDEQYEFEKEKLTKQLKANFQEELSQVHSFYRTKINSMSEDLIEKDNHLETERKEIVRLNVLVDTTMRECTEKMDKMTSDFENTLEESRIAWETITNQKLTDEAIKHEALVAEIELKALTTQAENTATHKKQMEDLRSFHTTTLLNNRKEAETLRSIEIAKLKTTNENTVLFLKVQHEETMKSAIAQLTDQKDKEISDIIDDWNQNQKQLQQEIEGFKEKLNQALESERCLKSEVAETEKDLAEQREILILKDKELKQRAKEFDAKFAKQATDYEIKTKQDKEHMKGDHLVEMQLMLQEFEKAKNFLKKEIALQPHNDRLEEAAIKYENREPRLIDVETINQMNKEIELRNHKIQELTKELSNYRLEMNNREISFNKIFNNSPMVGIMQPSVPKSQKGFKNKLQISHPKLPPLPSQLRVASASTIN
ncbi:hypothetical protein BC833DRAFT_660816 [Globomyces pollinis-pini]|nr:hypothetical protein BC833DRAFT_660816 [Globomyces pollinis-pini]